MIRKLCTTLVTYFLHFSASWTSCISHLTYCLCLGEEVPYQKLEDAPPMAVLAQNLSDGKCLAILWFSATLVEEVGKTDSNSMKQWVYHSSPPPPKILMLLRHKFHEYVAQNVDDIVAIMLKGIIMTPGVPINNKVRQESMKCFQVSPFHAHHPSLPSKVMNIHFISQHHSEAKVPFILYLCHQIA